jgi:hypothetical protein
VDDDGVIDLRFAHALQKMFGRDGGWRAVWPALMIGESRVVGAGKTMHVRVDPQWARLIAGAEAGAPTGGGSHGNRAGRLQEPST